MAEPLNAPRRAKTGKPSARAGQKPSLKTTRAKASPTKRARKKPITRSPKRAKVSPASTTSAKSQGGPQTTDRRSGGRRDEAALQRRRKRLLILVGVAGLFVLALVAWALLHQSIFRLHHVEVSGNVHESQHELMAISGLANTPALIDLSAAQIEDQMQQLPWVGVAKVSVVWPSTVKVTITERRPVGTVAVLGTWDVVDKTGRVLEQRKIQPAGLAQIEAPVTQHPVVGAFFTGISRGAFQVAGSLPVAFKSQVSLIVARPNGTVTLHLVRPVIIKLGHVTDLTQKYKDIAAVVAGATLHAGDVLDVSVPQSSTISGP